MDNETEDDGRLTEAPAMQMIVVWVDGVQVLMPADSIYIPYFARNEMVL
jgi:hypothetical protein